MKGDVDALKRACPMPDLMLKMGLGEFAASNVCSPFRVDKKPSWGIFEHCGHWFFKDQATGDTGDEITLLARWKGWDEKRDFCAILELYAEIAGVELHRESGGQHQPKSVPQNENSFWWSVCVSAFTPARAEELGNWRGYSPEFCAWLRTENLAGLHKGNWALPVHGDSGAVIGCHYRVDRGSGEKNSWFYYPKGSRVRPLVLGDLKRAEVGFIFESQWDAFAVMDKLGWHKPKSIPQTCIVITRGSGNGKLVRGLFTPEKTVYLFKQNDQTKDGKNAADDWFAAVCGFAGCKILQVVTPEAHKDVNDWTRAGATEADIVTAIVDARPVEPAPSHIQVMEQSQGSESHSRLSNWPEPLGEAAFHGVAGEFVKRSAPHTEADNAAILFQLLVGIGNLFGRVAFFEVEANRHFTNMNAVLVGNTSKSRKGVSWGRVHSLLREIDSSWKEPASGMSTGEGLIWAVRDQIVQKVPIKEKGKILGYQDEMTDEGIADKRLLVVEEEFARPLKCANRDHNTLSDVFRQAYDMGNLRTLTKANSAVASGAHISIIGHITKQELIRYLTDTECANGFANRILWVCVRRSKELPEGGNAHLVDFSDIVAQLKKAVTFAQQCRELRRDTEARELWRSIYHELSSAKPGLFGAVISRAEAYVTRLSLVYAILDCANFICCEHIQAALAAWRYCEDSARYIFGESLGNSDADAVLLALQQAGAKGLTRTEISDGVFNGHTGKAEIDRALCVLVEAGLAESRPEGTEGRTAERWFGK
jgi:hypothetical protein